MSIREHTAAAGEGGLERSSWTKKLELAKVARVESQQFDCGRPKTTKRGCQCD